MQDLEEEMEFDNIEVVLPETDSRSKGNLKRLKKRVQGRAASPRIAAGPDAAQPGEFD